MGGRDFDTQTSGYGAARPAEKKKMVSHSVYWVSVVHSCIYTISHSHTPVRECTYAHLSINR